MAEHDWKGLAFPRLEEAQMPAMRRCPLTTLAEVLGLCRPLERPRGEIRLVAARRIGNRFPASRSACDRLAPPRVSNMKTPIVAPRIPAMHI